jgi:hypothetical protein
MIDKNRLGYYQVGFKRFYNKSLAFLESTRTGYVIEWIFNNDIYSVIDWTKPIEIPLTELYRLRAQQLRDTYDYIVLSYSGGADSNNILHSFIDNNIFIDEIVMYLPETDLKNLNDYDRSARNGFGEVEFEAKRHLNEYKNKINPNTKIRQFDITKSTFELLKTDHWHEYSPTGSNCAIDCISRDHSTFEEFKKLASLYEGKKIAHLIGTDKPLVYFDGNDYYCFFSDNNACHIRPINNLESNVLDNCFTEFFYWARDFPEIVVKQAQEVKKHAEFDPHLRIMLNQIMKRHIGDYRSLLHPIIYPKHTEPEFQTSKESFNKGYRKREKWFWEVADNNMKYNFQNTESYLKKILKTSKIQSINVGFYKL